MKDDGKNWYVVHTYSGYEQRTRANLEHRIESMDVKDKISQVVVPTEDEVEIKGGQRRTVARKILPGYMLVQMKMDEESWNVVRNTPGVTGFVAAGNRPVPLEEEEVEKILNRMKTAVPKIRIGFSRGENVRIMEGPFAEFIGTVDEINLEKGKVRLMVSFFGRETPLELDLSQVQAI
ncbi:transcription termination/antitermination protein NusG [Dehalococcoidia bacterium]|nr:transcription termination/antitermination protein NusG [Dehalococcoidia bacterium]MCL0038972.1 transcription termination/antitermination protein NusG [Dehalococcoidia bacterium]MCL0072757.1 transcription termination/antitermination protein NusG [Dehalococcoidia bacterium]MCL0087224.1 transcription termination/antitermination protein NusG [Dehalococcoidia bacterium]MCL0091208.1 transcription termination/antitermination protein NusG [Dehalococcoidia bacterium]